MRFLHKCILTTIGVITLACAANICTPIQNDISGPQVQNLEGISVPLVILEQAEDRRNGVEKNLAATVHMDYVNNGFSTATIVGCQPIKGMPDFTKYFLLTAYHCVDTVVTESPIQVVGTNYLFPDAPPVYLFSECSLVIGLPEQDIAVLSFTSEIKDIPIAKMAAQDKFLNDTHVGDPIYAIGCDAGVFPLVRGGIIGGKTYVGLTQPSHVRALRFPQEYFSPSLNIWYGSSGGGIYNEDNEYIGMTVLIHIGRSGAIIIDDNNIKHAVKIKKAQSHLATALKSDVIKFFIEMANVGYVLEEIR